MAVAVYSHPSCALHSAGPGHPEAPGRIAAVLDALAHLPGAVLHTATPADPDIILTAHTPAHLQLLSDVHAAGGGQLDPDTVMSAHSWDAILGALGSVLSAVECSHAMESHAFAAVRPPGHHALADRAMGFCFVNNAVIGARRFQSLGRRRILIVDWDVHHGNGTQALVEHDAEVRFVSLHQSPWWPFSGAASERGVGNIFNVPRPPGLEPEQYVRDLWLADRGRHEGLGAGWGDRVGGLRRHGGGSAGGIHAGAEALPDSHRTAAGADAHRSRSSGPWKVAMCPAGWQRVRRRS